MTENKGDLISREALIKWIDDSVSQYGSTYSTDMLNMWGLFKDYLINNAPTVDLFCSYLSDGEVRQPCVEAPCKYERPQGEWIKHSTYKNVLICSKCNHGSNQVYDTFNFCPNCGASMVKGEKA